MKSILLSFILFFGIIWLFPACSTQSDEKSAEARLNNVDAVQAVAIANEWNWSKKEITSYVTPRCLNFLTIQLKKFHFPKTKCWSP